MSKVLDQAVTQESDGSWTFQCPGVVGAPCHGVSGQPFSSSGWPTKKVAAARGAQHFTEHKLGAEILAALALEDARVRGEGQEDGLTDEQREKVRADVIERSEHSVSQSLEEFRAEHGLVAHDNGTHAVRIEDLA
jgi:hypothetical protein